MRAWQLMFQLEATRHQLDSIKGELGSAAELVDRQVAEHKTRSEMRDAEVHALSGCLVECVAELRGTHTSLEEICASMDAELASLLAAHQDNTGKLQHDIAELTKTLAASKCEIQKLKTDLSKTLTNLREAFAENEMLRAEYNELHSNHIKLSAEKKRDQVRAEVDHLPEECDRCSALRESLVDRERIRIRATAYLSTNLLEITAAMHRLHDSMANETQQLKEAWHMVRRAPSSPVSAVQKMHKGIEWLPGSPPRAELEDAAGELHDASQAKDERRAMAEHMERLIAWLPEPLVQGQSSPKAVQVDLQERRGSGTLSKEVAISLAQTLHLKARQADVFFRIAMDPDGVRSLSGSPVQLDDTDEDISALKSKVEAQRQAIKRLETYTKQLVRQASNSPPRAPRAPRHEPTEIPVYSGDSHSDQPALFSGLPPSVDIVPPLREDGAEATETCHCDAPVSMTVKLELDFDETAGEEGSEKRDEFERAMKHDLALAAGVAPEQFVIMSLARGSVIVSVQVLPGERACGAGRMRGSVLVEPERKHAWKTACVQGSTLIASCLLSSELPLLTVAGRAVDPTKVERQA